jgi:hypothetical protein
LKDFFGDMLVDLYHLSLDSGIGVQPCSTPQRLADTADEDKYNSEMVGQQMARGIRVCQQTEIRAFSATLLHAVWHCDAAANVFFFFTEVAQVELLPAVVPSCLFCCFESRFPTF